MLKDLASAFEGTDSDEVIWGIGLCIVSEPEFVRAGHLLLSVVPGRLAKGYSIGEAAPQ